MAALRKVCVSPFGITQNCWQGDCLGDGNTAETAALRDFCQTITEGSVF